MKSLYHAYQCYENRVARGEFSSGPARKTPRQALSELLEVRIGNILINAGLRLKRHAVTGKSMAWSPLTGNQK